MPILSNFPTGESPSDVSSAAGSAVNTAINRTTAVNAADTNYSTLMARGAKLLYGTTYDAVMSWSSHLVDGAIVWRYE